MNLDERITELQRSVTDNTKFHPEKFNRAVRQLLHGVLDEARATIPYCEECSADENVEAKIAELGL